MMLNKEELKGLTRYSKLLNGTKVKLPPKAIVTRKFCSGMGS